LSTGSNLQDIGKLINLILLLCLVSDRNLVFMDIHKIQV